jgi:hypothetical protein
MKISIAFQIISIALLESSVLSIKQVNLNKRQTNRNNRQATTQRANQNNQQSNGNSIPWPDTPGADLTPLSSTADWENDCLKAHNFYRSKFFDVDAGKMLQPLQWNSDLAEGSKMWANTLLTKLGKDGELTAAHHSAGSDYGENMNGITGYGWKNDFTCSPGISRYYREVDDYYLRLRDWKQAGRPREMNFNGIYHFTQMMWPNTTQVGCGFALNEYRKIEVCRYVEP